MTVDYQLKHGAGSHLVEFQLSSGRGSLLADPFINAQNSIERSVSDTRWTDRSALSPVVLHPDLDAALCEPILDHPALAPDRWADEAERFLVNTLNTAIERIKAADGDLTDLMPEILSYLSVVASSPEAWERQREWLVGLRDTTSDIIAAGTLPESSASAWQLLGSAIQAAVSHRPDLIDPVAALEASIR
ncbi:hypothetical protein [Microbacterium schleiferi]|uniref:Uncharacterized protein n=1 Tax=Microbacterium schleiferi TaxID=69362 RepID=A0ABU7V6K8_9MICO